MHVGRVVGERERLVGVHEVEPVMRDSGSVLDRGLGGPDVKPAVNLARVGGDDLGGNAVGHQRSGQGNGEAGLARRRRARYHQERRVALRHAPTTTPRKA